jgi:hypothetical protein
MKQPFTLTIRSNDDASPLVIEVGFGDDGSFDEEFSGAVIRLLMAWRQLWPKSDLFTDEFFLADLAATAAECFNDVEITHPDEDYKEFYLLANEINALSKKLLEARRIGKKRADRTKPQ